MTEQRLVKLSVSQVSPLKRRLASEEGACPLCAKDFSTLEPKNIVLDHDHITGRVRGVLCRGCNGAEGKVGNAVGRWGGTGMSYANIIAWLENMLAYLKRQPLHYIYPTHLTEEEKKAAQAKKRRETAARKVRESR